MAQTLKDSHKWIAKYIKDLFSKKIYIKESNRENDDTHLACVFSKQINLVVG